MPSGPILRRRKGVSSHSERVEEIPHPFPSFHFLKFQPPKVGTQAPKTLRGVTSSLVGRSASPRWNLLNFWSPCPTGSPAVWMPLQDVSGRVQQGRLSKTPGNSKEEGDLENDPPKVVYELQAHPWGIQMWMWSQAAGQNLWQLN